MKTKSFTLIELLIVIVIIGILATLAFREYEYMKWNATGKEAMETLRMLANAAMLYRTETGAFYNWVDHPAIPPDNHWDIPEVLAVPKPARPYYQYHYLNWFGTAGIQIYCVLTAASGGKHLPGIVYQYEIAYLPLPEFQFPNSAEAFKGQYVENGLYVYYVKEKYRSSDGQRCAISGW
ncbi:MAG: prepilin-type N-terminal cleavage/methylation domain-containing protein [Candidatus Omnitrophica bacterium]|nr:prepilin-type N-terminal cleavage/methylation domain-containing protein [Candidatus Omnitrophota bacterium]